MKKRNKKFKTVLMTSFILLLLTAINSRLREQLSYYLTLNFKRFDDTDYLLFYEYILVSNHVKSNISGAKTKSRFKSCTIDFEKQTLVYTSTKDENVAVKFYKEQLNVASAYIEVTRTSVVFHDEVKLVKRRLQQANHFLNLS